MAHEFPGADVVVVDQVRQVEEVMPANVTFQAYDPEKGLAPHHDQYDLVQARFVAHDIKSYRCILAEAPKCLRPGGVVIFIEGDLDIYEEDQKTCVAPVSENNPHGSHLQRWMQGCIHFSRFGSP
jgi:SAM-dependent methyltransferase